MNCVVLVVKRL